MHGDRPTDQSPASDSRSTNPFVDLATLVVAIDGPSGAGKSTVARGVARALGLRYLDTGATYRALTWAVLSASVDPTNEAGVVGVARTIRLSVATDPDAVLVRVDDHDVTKAIRGEEVTAAVSAVSAFPVVRDQLVALQQSMVGRGGIVVEGRDIGTVVCPDAPVKIFLTASPESRASRRFAEGHDGTSVAAVQTDLARRDTLDSTRTASPLQRASDSILLDTTSMDADSAIATILQAVAVHAPDAAARSHS